ncbi:MAG: TIM barrel protein [Verrucomicrobiota bacterium]
MTTIFPVSALCRVRAGAWLLVLALSAAALSSAQGAEVASIWNKENLQAWCIVPYDAKKRTPEERAEMLKRIGLRAYAYDFRPQHIPEFDREVEVMKAQGIELTAWWFSSKMDDNARKILATIERQKIKPTLWVSGGGAPAKNAAEQVARITSEVARIKPIAEAAQAQGLKIALYNHQGWFGDPDNQLAVLEGLRREGAANVGIVYNFHHAHEHIRTFAAQWPRMMPHVVAVNVSGIVENGDRAGKKIQYVGEGDQEMALMKVIAESGWRGPIGVLCHRTDVDAEEALQRNMAGVATLAAKLAAEPPALKKK